MAGLLMKQKALSIRESYEVYSKDELKYIIQRRKLLTSKPAFDISVESGVLATADITSTSSPKIYKIAFNGEDGGEIRFDGISGVNKLIYEAKGLEIDGNSILTEFTVKDKNKKNRHSFSKFFKNMKGYFKDAKETKKED